MTLDEAANRHANEGWKTVDGEQTGDINPVKWASFVSGANWQDEQTNRQVNELGLLVHRLCKMIEDNLIEGKPLDIKKVEEARSYIIKNFQIKNVLR